MIARNSISPPPSREEEGHNPEFPPPLRGKGVQNSDSPPFSREEGGHNSESPPPLRGEGEGGGEMVNSFFLSPITEVTES